MLMRTKAKTSNRPQLTRRATGRRECGLKMKYQSAPGGCRRVVMESRIDQVLWCPGHMNGCPPELFADEPEPAINPNDPPWDDGTYDDEYYGSDAADEMDDADCGLM